jgi:hypothetical protein
MAEKGRNKDTNINILRIILKISIKQRMGLHAFMTRITMPGSMTSLQNPAKGFAASLDHR